MWRGDIIREAGTYGPGGTYTGREELGKQTLSDPPEVGDTLTIRGADYEVLSVESGWLYVRPIQVPEEDTSSLAYLVKTADVEGLRNLFSLGDWDTRETVMVAFREVYRQHQEDGSLRERLRGAVTQALSLCRADASGGSYRQNCIDAGERLLSDIQSGAQI